MSENYMIKNYKKSLIEPLSGEELHIFHSNRYINNLIHEFMKIIDDQVHGCYLVGGIRGVGKTSFINLCCEKYSKNKLLKINLDCNKFINHNNFIYFFIEELVKVIEDYDLSNQLSLEIKNLHNRVIFKNITKLNQSNINKDAMTDSYEQIESTKAFFNLSFINKIFNFSKNHEKMNKYNTQKNASTESSKVFELEVRNDEFILIDELSKILKKLSETYQVIIIIDEIDKQDESFLENLFDLYKNLFLNSHVISMFIVDQNKYQNFISSSEMDNKLKLYFIKTFYLPTFEFDDIKSYLYREFEINNLAEVSKAFFLSSGVIRKLNNFRYLNGYSDKETLLKAIFFCYLLDNFPIEKYKSNYVRDIYKIIVKDFIELFFYNCKIDKKSIISYFQSKFAKHNIPDIAEEIVMLFKGLSLEHNNFIIVENDDSGEIFKLQVEVKSLFDIYNKYEEVKVEFDKDLRHSTNINRKFLKFKSNSIRIAESDTKGFSHFIRILETNFNDIDNIIIVKKVSDLNKSEAIVYSAILIINKPIGYIFYYIENCSFSYERPFTVENLIDFMKTNDIPTIIIETDYEPIMQNIDFIFDRVNEIIYKE